MTDSLDDVENLSRALLGEPYATLSDGKQTVIESIAAGDTVAEDTNQEFDEQLTFGQRVADKVAAFGGSWSFIIFFSFVLASWMTVNAFYLSNDQAFDPYPFILLNLVLSSLAAFQAPIIMMSQNRQSAKDRIEAEKNFQVSLKSDLELMRLQQKVDLILKAMDLSESDEENELTKP